MSSFFCLLASLTEFADIENDFPVKVGYTLGTELSPITLCILKSNTVKFLILFNNSDVLGNFLKKCLLLAESITIFKTVRGFVSAYMLY